MSEKQIKDFPSVLDVEEHIKNQTNQSNPKKPWTFWVIISLVVLILGLATVKFLQSNPAVLFNGKGSVSGTIVNTLATPVSAEIYLLKSKISTTTDSNGKFVLRDIPSGPRQIIVTYDGIGHEIPVSVAAGINFELGQIQVETTQVVPEK
jgi:hypothetical protein